MNVFEGQEQAEWFRSTFESIRSEVGRVIVGQSDIVSGVLVCMASNGHVLLEGMPGLGKTILIKTLSQVVDLSFSRIQFTPDMMPADVTGTNVLSGGSTGSREFEFRRGPIFANLILADEINRATPKTQSALLEAMQERSVTVGGTRHDLEEPFLVMATQNPIEQEGTYLLPEAQLDRFFFKLVVPYLSKSELAEVINRTTGTETVIPEPKASKDDIRKMRQIVREVPIVQDILDYSLSIVMATHPSGQESSDLAQKYSRYGASPRGAQSLITASKVYALLDGRFHVSKDDVKKSAISALRHRVLLNFEAEADGVVTDHIVVDAIKKADSLFKDPVKV